MDVSARNVTARQVLDIGSSAATWTAERLSGRDSNFDTGRKHAIALITAGNPYFPIKSHNGNSCDPDRLGHLSIISSKLDIPIRPSSSFENNGMLIAGHCLQCAYRSIPTRVTTVEFHF